MRGIAALLTLLLLPVTAPAQAPVRAPAARIVVQATGDDWISVADASGHVVLARFLHNGQRLALPDEPGLAFTAGNAPATELIVDGVSTPPLGGGIEKVVHNQPLDPALIAAGRLPAQIAAARAASASPTPVSVSPPPASANIQPLAVAMSAPKPQPAPTPAPTPAPAPSPQAAGVAPADAAPAARVVVQATGDDWISVADTSGRVVLTRLLHSGQRLGLPDEPGLVFTAGNAPATELIVDGVAAPPLGGGIDNVAANQPLDPALIAAGRLPTQLRVARAVAASQAVAASPPPASANLPPAPAPLPAAHIQPVAMVMPGPDPAASPTPPPVAPPPVAPADVAPADVASADAAPAALPALAPPLLAPTQAPAAFAPSPTAALPAQTAALPVSAAPTRLVPMPTASAAPTTSGSTILLTSGTGEVISLAAPAASVFTADPKVADVRPASPTSLFVLGVAPGETTIAALDQAGHPIAQYRVTVTPSAFGADAAGAAIARLVPDAHVTLTALPDGLAVAGTAPTAADAAEVMALARGYVDPKQTVHDELSVLSEVQVSLQVRIAEMARTITRELGVNWQALGTTGGKITANFMAPSALAFLNTAANTFNLTYHSGNANVNAIIDALAQDQLARLLAEPNLTAMSGQTASFLVGGEFPIPVALQNGSISVQFQPYGVSLSFIPTVLADNRISLRVRPEVSELTTQGAVQLSEGNSTIQIPALLVRRTETTVELGSGQSFAIAGLLQDQTTQVDQGLPGLSEVPILGALFNSNSFQRNETELVIVVTPYIVRPVSGPSALRLPTEDWAPPSDLERILFHRQQATGNPAASPAHIPGDAGFIVQ